MRSIFRECAPRTARVLLSRLPSPSVLRFSFVTLLIIAVLSVATPYAHAQVKSHQKISDTAGGFTGTLDDLDLFGRAVASLGDLDGDTVTDLVVGAYKDDDGGADRGAAWILFLNSNGTVKSHQKISDGEGTSPAGSSIWTSSAIR